MKNKKVILITGASSGIGAALAAAYAAEDVILLLTGRSAPRLAETAGKCRAKGAEVKIAVADVTDRASMKNILESWDDMDPVDIVIANAGISGGVNDGEDKFYEIIDTSIHGTFNTVLPLVERMKRRKSGQIAVMSSMAGWRGMPNAPAYSTAKVAVRAYGEAMRPLLAKYNVGMSVIFPGFVATPLTEVNGFPMPMLMRTERAAAYIKDGLDKNKARIAFPFPMLLAARFVAALPLAIGDYILGKAPKK